MKGYRKRRSLFSRLTFGTFSLLVAGLLVMSYLSVLVNPAKGWFFTIFGLLYLPLLVLALLFFIWALLRRSRWVGLLLLVLLPSLLVAGRFVQLRKPQVEPSSESVKLVSYNLGLFAHGTKVAPDRNALTDSLLRYLVKTDADILCLQEFYLPNGQDVKHFFQRYFPGYHIEYYVLTGAKGAAGNVTLSRFPMSARGKISFEHSTNMAICTDLDIRGEKIRVYNCHFESYNISLPHLVQSFSENDSPVEEASGKMRRAASARPLQVDQVLRDIEASPSLCLVAGDFNDNPLSYTYMRLKRGRKDAFREAGEGFGATYSALWPLLRIDYVLYPDVFKAISYEVERVPYSDHYPVLTVLEKREKDAAERH